MAKTNQPITWVVYQRTLLAHKKPCISNAVCEQSEWDVMKAVEPTTLTLIQDGFTNESEAEKHARGTSGDTFRRAGARKS